MEIINYNMSYWHAWDKGLCNRDKYILDGLVKNPEVEKVLSVDFIPFNLRSAAREYLLAKIYKRDENTVLKGLTYKVNKKSDKLYSCSTLCERPLKKIARELGFKNPAILSHNPFARKYFEYFKASVKFFEANDNWVKNETFAKYKDKLADNYRFIHKNSAKIFSVSENLKSEIFANDPNVDVAPNGVAIEHFQKNIVVKERIKKAISFLILKT